MTFSASALTDSIVFVVRDEKYGRFWSAGGRTLHGYLTCPRGPPYIFLDETLAMVRIRAPEQSPLYISYDVPVGF